MDIEKPRYIVVHERGRQYYVDERNYEAFCEEGCFNESSRVAMADYIMEGGHIRKSRHFTMQELLENAIGSDNITARITRTECK